MLRLARTPDILAELGERRARGELGDAAARRVRGGDRATWSARAREKRRRKQVDLIVANDVSQADAGFDVDTNAVTLVTAEDEQDVPLQSKAERGRAILDRRRGAAGRFGRAEPARGLEGGK